MSRAAFTILMTFERKKHTSSASKLRCLPGPMRFKDGINLIRSELA